MKKILLIACGMAAAALPGYAKWGTDAAGAIEVFPEGTLSYSTELATTPDGGVWATIYHPNLEKAEGEGDIRNVVYEYRLQYWDKNGNPAFAPEGMLVSNFKNKSYTVVNNLLSTDAEGNALLCVSDCRNSAEQDMSYTAYKVSPAGEMLWSEEGKPITDPLNPADFGAMITAVPLEDGSFVFSWIEGTNDGATNVMLQRLDKDGNMQWDQKKVSVTDEVSSNPYLIPSGDNTCILVYTRTTSDVVYARKLDFEGSNVWGKDTRVYRGGWGTIPLHTLLRVVPSGNGGALISWNDDRHNTNIESAFLSYITPDGKLGFGNVSDEGDVKLGYSGLRCFNVCAAPATDGSCFYATWRETNTGQSWQGLRMQKISPEGELLWGDDGLDYVPLDQKSIGYISLQSAAENEVMLFHEEYYEYFDQAAYASLLDTEGKNVWKEGTIALSRRNRQATQLKSLPLPGAKSWVYYWNDQDGVPDAEVCTRMGLLNIDGTFGDGSTGIETVTDESGVTVRGNRVYTDGNSLRVFDTSGRNVLSTALTDGIAELTLPAGLYIGTVDNDKSFKIIIK